MGALFGHSSDDTTHGEGVKIVLDDNVRRLVEGHVTVGKGEKNDDRASDEPLVSRTPNRAYNF